MARPGGSAAAWTLVGASGWAINTNVLAPSSYTAPYTYAYVDSGKDAHSCQVKLSAIPTVDGRGIGLVVRWKDANNFYMAYFYRTNSTTYGLYIDKVVAGSWTGGVNLSLGATPLNVGDTFKVSCAGSTIWIEVNGVTKLTLTDTGVPTGTKTGPVYLGGLTAGSVDDLVVRA